MRRYLKRLKYILNGNDRSHSLVLSLMAENVADLDSYRLLNFYIGSLLFDLWGALITGVWPLFLPLKLPPIRVFPFSVNAVVSRELFHLESHRLIASGVIVIMLEFSYSIYSISC